MNKSMQRSTVRNNSWYRSMLAGNDFYNPLLPYWMAISEVADSSSYGQGVAVDSSGNVYMGQPQNGAVTGFNTMKVNSLGVLQWQRGLIGDSNSTLYDNRVGLDSSGNVYTCGIRYYGISPYYRSVEVAKYDSNGTIQWQKLANNKESREMVVDASGNTYYIGGADGGTGNYNARFGKVTTSGTVAWGRQLYSAAYEYGYGIAVDSSSAVFVVLNSAGAAYYAKYDSNGNLSWQNKLNTTSFTAGGAAVDSSGNFYFSGKDDNYDTFLAKVNSSGVLQWQRRIGVVGSGSQDYQGNLAIDSSSNVYMTFISNNSGVYDQYVAKFDTSGTLQWQRKFSVAGYFGSNYDIAVDSTCFYVSATMTPTGRTQGSLGFFCKLPIDGSSTGPFKVGNYWVTYAASSLTVYTPTYTASSGSLSSNDPGDGFSTSFFTDQAGTQTLTRTAN